MPRRSRAPWTLLLAGVLALAPSACDEFGGGPRTVSGSGYRATLSFSPSERYEIAVRGVRQRVSGNFEGGELVKILRPDAAKMWQFRPATRKLVESPWTPGEELVPGYPLEPRFDPVAYAERFGARVRRIDDAAHGMHPCERFQMAMPSGDRAVIWVARDLERLVVRIQHFQRDPKDELQPVTDTQLFDVRLGAPSKLFEKPSGYAPVRSYADLSR